MKPIVVMFFLCAQTLLGIEAIKFEFEDYETVISFVHSTKNPFKGTIENETELFGHCRGTFFYDLEHSRLKLKFLGEKCAAQNIEIYLDNYVLNTIKNGLPSRVFFAQEMPPFNPQQAIMRICPKISFSNN